MKTTEAVEQLTFAHDYLLGERKKHRLAFIEHSTPYRRVVGRYVPQLLSEQADNLCRAQELLQEMKTWGELTTFSQLQDLNHALSLLETAIAFWDRVDIDLADYRKEHQKEHQ